MSVKISGIIFACLFVVALLTGCATEPFARTPMPVLYQPNPKLIRENFARAVPEQFTSDDTIIVQAPFHDALAILGVLNIDRKAGTFELYGLSPIGVQFFHVGGDRTDVAVRDAIPPLMVHKDILLAVARDIQRIYFGMGPDADAQVRIRLRSVTYRSEQPEGALFYDFGYEPAVLLEKRLNGFFGTIWRVQYYDYRSGAQGKVFPHGIVMDNYRYHYRIIIKNRDWSVGE